MQKTLKVKSILAVLISSFSIQSCDPTANVSPSASPSAIPTVMETVKPVESVAPTATPTPNVVVSPIEPPIASTIPSVTPSLTPTIAPTVQPKTYLVPISLNSGKGTAYITLNSNTSGKILINFQDISDAPTKVNLIDQNGNNIITSNSFSVAMSGNFSSTFLLQPQQLIRKLQLFFANGRMVENIIDDTILSSSPEATPIPPNPTPVKTPELPTIYPHTYINGTMVTTFAGSSTAGFVNANRTTATFNGPAGITVDSNNNIYVADYNNHAIRKIDTSGVVTTFAGNGSSGFVNGTGTNASFDYPWGIAVDSNNNVYVADFNNNAIRKIDTAGVVTTFAGGSNGFVNGTGTNASFSHPSGLAVDSNNNVYVADYNNHAIRKIDTAGVVTTFAGGSSGFVNGTGTNASFNYPEEVAVDSNNNIYVADSSNNAIRKINTAGVVTTFAGSGSIGFVNGAGTNASFDYPSGLTVDSNNNIYVGDINNNLIRKINTAGIVTTFAGNVSKGGFVNGVGSNASFSGPWGIAVDRNNNVYVADYYNNAIRKIK